MRGDSNTNAVVLAAYPCRHRVACGNNPGDRIACAGGEVRDVRRQVQQTIELIEVGSDQEQALPCAAVFDIQNS